MRKWGIAPIVIGCAVAAAGLPASAADDKTITAQANNTWAPPTITVAAGEKVTWTNNDAKDHNLLIDGREVVPSGQAWNHERTFTAAEAGEHPFECDLHTGMTGRVIVQAPTQPTPTPTPTPSPGATPTPTPTPAPPPSARLRIRRLAPVRGSFCTRRSRTCRRPGVTLRIDLSQPAAVRGTLERRRPRGSKRFRRVGRVNFGRVASGPRRLRFSRASRRVLAAGSYRLRLQVDELRRTVRFRVRSSRR